MKIFFKEFRDAMISLLVAILLILFSPFILIWLIIATIRDYIKYKKSLYYQDTYEKYSWMCGSSYYVAFYDAIKSAGLSIDYYRSNEVKLTGYGYFIYNDILLLCDYDSDTLHFDKDNDEWLVYDEDDYLLLETEIDEEIKKVNEFLGKEQCKRVILFVESEMLVEVPEKHYDRIEFLPIIDGDKISALKSIVV